MSVPATFGKFLTKWLELKKVWAWSLVGLFLLGLAIAQGCGLVSQAERPLRLGLPIACQLNRDCFILSYPDRDPGPPAVDFGCGRMTNDGHQGTDFAIPNLQVMAQGVPVQAAAAGKVLRIRDGVPDRRIDEPLDESAIQGTECGNGLVIDHGNGWETQYCHLRQNSLAVKPGDEVGKGTVLGLVGMSGLASFPHVHLTVRYQGQVVDPFVGTAAGPGCQVDPQPLWENFLSYVPTGVIRAGFAQQPPQLKELWEGAFEDNQLPAEIPALVFWVHLYGVLQGDEEYIQLIAPNGQLVVNQRRTLSTSSRVWMAYAGKRNRSQTLTPGKWQGKYQLVRGKQTLIDWQQEVLLQ
jgi:murein DD-endopeptidase MepM/ murein hydrolase activator NlpD